jgi:serine protease inhibitor
VTRDFIPHLEANGFTCWQAPDYNNNDSCARYESGWHPGQTDTPEKVRDLILADSKDWEIVFVLTDKGQFDCGWTAYVRKQQTTNKQRL